MNGLVAFSLGVTLLLVAVNAFPKERDWKDGKNSEDTGGMLAGGFAIMALIGIFVAGDSIGRQVAIAVFVFMSAACVPLVRSHEAKNIELRRGQAQLLLSTGAAFVACSLVFAIFF
jgi:hypothetical protein